MTIEEWKMSDELKQELKEHYKTAYSLSLTECEPLDIARALTFDGLANTVTIEGLTKFLSKVNENFAEGKIRGVGLEIGSGPGTFVAALAQLPSVSKVYGVEACGAIVEKLMTKVVIGLAKTGSEKIVGAIGDFDALQLEDASVDFIFDFFSLHHSADLSVTLKELSRVLKPGGVVICIDKARANSMSEADLNRLLDREYTTEAKRAMGYPPEKFHTRRMNGEKEYRLKDWSRYFSEAGFTKLSHYNIAKIGGRTIVQIVKRAIAYMPVSIQSKLTRLISKKITNDLEPSNRLFVNLFPEYPREFSFLIATK